MRKRVHPSTYRSASNNQVGGSPRSNAIIPSIEHRDSPTPTRFSTGPRVSDSNYISDAISGASTAYYRRPLDELSQKIDLIDLTEDPPEFSKRRRLESREFSHDSHRPSSYKEDFAYSYTGKSASQRAPAVILNQDFGPIPDGSGVTRMPKRRNEALPFIMNGSREETDHKLHHTKDILRDSPGAVTIPPLEAPEIHIGSGFSVLSRPHIDRLPQYRDPSLKADGYETESPRVKVYREERSANSHHSRGFGSDDAVWRNKANSYRSQRRLLEAQDPSWSKSMPKSSFYTSRAQRPERATHSPAFTQEDNVEPFPNVSFETRAEISPRHYTIQGR